MSRPGLILLLTLAVAVTAVAGVMLGEVAFGIADYGRAISAPTSLEGQVLWQVRAPRTVCALTVGAALGLSGAVMQGLLRNPLAEPGVLGVSALSGLGAAVAIVAGGAAIAGMVEGAALIGALAAGAALIAFTLRVRAPEALILFGVAMSSFAGAATALIFNLSPSPIASAEVMAWLLGSVQNRGWGDVAWAVAGLSAGAVLARAAMSGLRVLTLGEDAAAVSGIDMRRARLAALASAAVATGAATAVAGVIGFVGLAAPHLVRRAVRGDPGRVLAPSALAGAAMLGAADLLARLIPTDQELKLGVLTALVGAPLFALIAWRTAREWRL